MNKLYLRIPTKHAPEWQSAVLDYALCSKEGDIVREGRGTLAELSKDIFKSKVVLLIAASDVTLLGLTIPPMADSKLKLALPNLVVDQLMSDPADCVLTLATTKTPNKAPTTGKRVVAIAERSWLQQLSTSLYGLGASHVKALPAQLCIPHQSEQVSAYIEENSQVAGTELSVRFDVDSGIGLLLQSDPSIEEQLSTIFLLSPQGPVSLLLPSDLIAKYKAAVEANPSWAERITIVESTWSKTIEAASTVGFNLMAGLNTAQASRIQWQMWRWPAILGGLTLLINIVGLNGSYWSLKREEQTLKLGMMQTYKMSFPKDAVVPFPLQQMRKNVQIAERNSGQPAAYDFTVLLTGLGAAWSSIDAAKLPKIKSIEYKDSGLLVQFDGDLPQKELQKALAEKDLNLKKINAEVWQIKGA